MASLSLFCLFRQLTDFRAVRKPFEAGVGREGLPSLVHPALTHMLSYTPEIGPIN
jgi:hypothetical protein